MDRFISDTRFAVVISVAVAVTAVVYVAFGPPTLENTLTTKKNSRKKGKTRRLSGEPKGLHNAGNTCFVNAILQAIAACPTMLLWLEERREELMHPIEKSPTSNNGNEGNDIDTIQGYPKLDNSKSILQLALLKVLRVANGNVGLEDGETGENKEIDQEIWAPAALFRALRAHRWVINTDEQDAHEFFQVLLSTVEEELQKEPKVGPTSLFDTSEIETFIVNNGKDIVAKSIKNQNGPNETFSCTDTGLKPAFESDIEEASCTSDNEKARVGSRCSRRPSRRKGRKCNRSSSGVFVRSGEELSMENVIKQTRLAALSTPFTGTLTNKLSFRGSGKCKSPTSSTIFNNITLSLPNFTTDGSSTTHAWVSGVTNPPVTLETLLQMFVSVEAVSSGTSTNDKGNIRCD